MAEEVYHRTRWRRGVGGLIKLTSSQLDVGIGGWVLVGPLSGVLELTRIYPLLKKMAK
ncbi:hypothetical protein [Coxiella endosymbiont of Ornithodoros amblus]|uniref:hypothetical protein n=1 Tax=Coxiella endosymbiont of Ornithodoros amblus TaxID=1656166 RepID=UPI00244E36CF|nr:hypothetical protein [Coxiella endosymbiont of Ornithodoros amblus]